MKNVIIYIFGLYAAIVITICERLGLSLEG